MKKWIGEPSNQPTNQHRVDRQAGWLAGWLAGRQAGRQTDRQTDEQIHEARNVLLVPKEAERDAWQPSLASSVGSSIVLKRAESRSP